MNGRVSTKEKVIRALIHIPVGIFNVFCGYVGWPYALIFCLGFLCYEVIEDWREKDRGFYDVFGYLIGLATGVIFLAVYKLFGGVRWTSFWNF
jgi:hypothetical protein